MATKEEEIKVDKWDGCTLKNALDDVIRKRLLPNYGDWLVASYVNKKLIGSSKMTFFSSSKNTTCDIFEQTNQIRNDIFTDDLKYAEKNLYVDIRLVLSTLGCGVALYALLYDYLYPFPASKIVLTVCVLSYFTLMSILTLFMTFVEKNIILVSKQKEASGLDPDSEWVIKTTLKRFDNNFTLEISKTDGTSKNTTHGGFTKCVSSWVNVDGVILVDKLKTDVLNSHRDLNSVKKDQ